MICYIEVPFKADLNCILKISSLLNINLTLFLTCGIYQEFLFGTALLILSLHYQSNLHITFAKYYIYHGSYELTYLNQRIRKMSWFK